MDIIEQLERDGYRYFSDVILKMPGGYRMDVRTWVHKNGEKPVRFFAAWLTGWGTSTGISGMSFDRSTRNNYKALRRMYLASAHRNPNSSLYRP